MKFSPYCENENPDDFKCCGKCNCTAHQKMGAKRRGLAYRLTQGVSVSRGKYF